MGGGADRRGHEGSPLCIGKRAEPAILDKIGHAIIRDLIGGAFSSSLPSTHLRCSSQLAGSGRSSFSSISARLARPSRTALTMYGASSANRRIRLT
jgi:hypothetical protein